MEWEAHGMEYGVEYGTVYGVARAKQGCVRATEAHAGQSVKMRWRRVACVRVAPRAHLLLELVPPLAEARVQVPAVRVVRVERQPAASGAQSGGGGSSGRPPHMPRPRRDPPPAAAAAPHR
eukprot:4571518-Prymnesium_polylepis.1